MLPVRLDSSLKNQLDFLAKQKGISKSQITKDALVYYFDTLKSQNRQKTAYELGKDLFGRYGSDNTNLSTTYKQRLNNLLRT